jgi:two-component system, NarL family, nitrate/nitrite response regulator NarL
MKLRVLLVDDHKIVREGIHALLSAEPDLQVVAQASSGVAAVLAAEEYKPDLVLMEISMPDMDGIEVIRRVCRLEQSIRILVLTVHDNSRLVRAAVAAGASGYVLKDESFEDLLSAIRLVAAGGAYYSASVRNAVLSGGGDPSEA